MYNYIIALDGSNSTWRRLLIVCEISSNLMRTNILQKYEKVALGIVYILLLPFSMTITMKERIKGKWHSWQLENNLRGVLAIAFWFQ